MNSDSSQFSSVLTEAVMMLCQNGVEYSENLRIQGILVVTADSSRVHVVEIREMFPSPQAGGVGSSGLCETETDIDYKPPVQMEMQSLPVHLAATRQKMSPTVNTKAGVHHGFDTVRAPVKRRGGFHGIAASSQSSRQKMGPAVRTKAGIQHGFDTVRAPVKRRGGFLGIPDPASSQRIAPKVPKVLEDTIILDDSPENTTSDVIEPKLETDWTDATHSYQNISEFPDAGDMPGYHGTDMPLFSNAQSYSASGSRHSQLPDAVARTVTSSDGVTVQSQDIKPFQLNYNEEQDVEDDGQSHYTPVDRSLYSAGGRRRSQRPDAVTHTVTSSDRVTDRSQDMKTFQLNYSEEQDVGDDRQSLYTPVGRILLQFYSVVSSRHTSSLST